MEEEIVSSPDEKTKRNWKKEFADFFKDLAIILVIVFIIRSFFILPFQINGQSMYDSYYDKEFIIVDRFSYIVWEPKRGDVIVFKPHVSKEREYFIKRIIGLPGEKIKIEDGKVYLYNAANDSFDEILELYLSESNKDSTFIRWENESHIYEIPEGSYFVMWDNRIASTDSRTCFSNCAISWKTNYIIKKNMVGKVLLDLWYFNFRDFNFVHPILWIDTHPKFFHSQWNYDYSK